MAGESSQAPSLLIVLGHSLGTALVARCPETGFDFAGKRFWDTGAGDFNGFYDWLRDAEGRLLGVRFWPFDEAIDLVRSAADRPGIVTPPTRDRFDLYFLDACRFADESQSGDQAFGDNRVYKSNDGECALSFGTHSLTAAELESVKRQVSTTVEPLVPAA